MTLQPGKLPQHLLAELLNKLPIDDARVIIGPGIGRDAAVIDIVGDRVLVAKTDPITFATEHIGWYAVNVNANDIACMGARPEWMLATVLLPARAPESLASDVFGQLSQASLAMGITLVGGHTEVTLGIDRPIVVGAMLGTATRDEIITAEGVRPGDAVVLTKGIAIEGTALLAREAGRELGERGVASEIIERAAAMLFAPGISVVPDARTICGVHKPRLLHDPTEGGVATALHEMSQAANARFRIDGNAIRVFDETRMLCGALGLNPLGLLASGSLLAIIATDQIAQTQRALESVGIPSAVIGKVIAGAPEVILATDDRETPLPRFDRDELVRFLEGATATRRAPEGP